MFKSRANRLATWIALVAIVFASFAPTISHAFAAKNNVDFQQEVCDAQGTKRFVHVDLALEKQSAPAENASTAHLEHCPYCASHINHVTTPPTSLVVLLSKINAFSRINSYSAPSVQSYFPVSHPAHAPPAI